MFLFHTFQIFLVIFIILLQSCSVLQHLQSRTPDSTQQSSSSYSWSKIVGTSWLLLLLVMPLLLNRGGCSFFCLHPHCESSCAGDCPQRCCNYVLESKMAFCPSPGSTTYLFVGICIPITKQSRLVSPLFTSLSLVSSMSFITNDRFSTRPLKSRV